MTIERVANEIIIKIPSSVDIDGVQQLIDYLQYKEITSRSKATQADVDKLTQEIKKGSWAKRRSKLIK